MARRLDHTELARDGMFQRTGDHLYSHCTLFRLTIPPMANSIPAKRFSRMKSVRTHFAALESHSASVTIRGWVENPRAKAQTSASADVWRLAPLLLLPFLLLFFTVSASAQQLWTGVLSPARGTDWTNAGVVGGIPSGSWTQCGPTVSAGASAATINSAIASCGTNQYVLLGPGTFNLSAAIDFGHKGNVALRGSGANSTFLVFGSGVSDQCNAPVSTLICIDSADSTYFAPTTVYHWTAGYAQGSTSITLSSTANISPNATVIALDQCDDGYTGDPCSGTSTDNGAYYNCSDIYLISPSITGCSFNGPDMGNGRTHRYQTELMQVTAVNSSTGAVTLSRPLRNPNWRSGQTPEAWFFQPIQYAGVENLSVDASSNSTAGEAICFFNAANVWVKGVRIINANVTPVYSVETIHYQYEQNYLYGAQSPDPFGFRQTVAADGLIQNNIVQQIRVGINEEGANNGSVISYNFFILQSYASDAMFEAIRPHAGGDNYELMEGNVGVNYYGEDYHGSHLMQTAFRNFFTGWESCGSGQCGSAGLKDYQTNAFMLDTYNRYTNAVGNVLGTPGYHRDYQVNSGFQAADNHAIWAIGLGNGGVSPQVPSDPVVTTTFFRWANYDTVTGAVRFCGNASDTGFVTTCLGLSEVPTLISPYPNPVPTLGDTGIGQGPLPASFYLSSKPTWFGSVPFPPIGPDVINGTVGVCSGTLNTVGQFAGVPALSNAQCTGTSLLTGWAGHSNAIPAMNCALNVMGMPPDGSGPALAFDPNACYASAGPPPMTPALTALPH